MKRSIIPFIAFLVILLLVIPFSVDSGASVFPGWNTTTFPLYQTWTVIFIIILLFVTIGYWLFAKKADKINWSLFIIHFILSIPTTIFIKIPSLLLSVQNPDQEQLFKDINFSIKLIPIAWQLFLAGQILFLIYYIRTIRIKDSTQKATTDIGSDLPQCLRTEHY